VTVSVVDWLLASDPAIRWQVMRDITGEPAPVVAAERAKVANEGWGATLLELQGADGHWGRDVLPAMAGDFPDPETRALLRRLHRVSRDDLAGFLDIDVESLTAWERGEPDPEDEGAARYRRAVTWLWNGIGSLKPEWTSTTWSLSLLRDLGLDPGSDQARRAVALVRDNVKWDHDGQDYFDGEVEPCINGKAVAIGAYFGENVDGIVDRLLGEQLVDGGWNCEAERGSTRSSFHTTIAVLDGLLEFERADGPSAEVTGARLTAHEYLLERRLFRRRSTNEIVDPAFTRFSFPTGWHYDVLRGLDHLRSAGAEPDVRCAEAIELVVGKRDAAGRWPLENTHPGLVHFEMDEGDGRPSRWNTLRAMRVLDWYRGR
jgi:DNA-binding XRE family transcriptional regulator